ncbi:Aste57867_8260 [Aphanomyces stellatus]|uniref:Aste57867_8260 protein n=1 Tax=Aphanomyces stellatus TaxID=120398 RepID=A0A485KJU2_9STRA|nr:hypothetical protein As57867_008229 [Aphanomyces stellatus]VFT85147.1 Aste57867_8260 [Aphanomyces stellatus]
MDTAVIRVNYTGPENVTLFATNDNCWECDLLPQVFNDCEPTTDDCLNVYKGKLANFNFSSIYPADIELRKSSDNTTVVWKAREHFVEHATYGLNVSSSNGSIAATYGKIDDGSRTVMPYLMLAVVLVWVLSCCGIFFAKKRTDSNVDKTITPGLHEEMLPRDGSGDCHTGELLPVTVQDTDLVVVKKERIVCLDVFRGIDLFYMIFCNQGGGGYWFFDHSAWNGLNPTDFVFPWFAFIMGVTMNIGMGSQEKKGTALWRILLDVSIRSVKLFLLGMYCNNYRSVNTGRIPGVLQSFGFAYLVTAIAILLGRAVESPTMPVLRRAVEGAVIFVVVLIYLMVTFFLPVDGCPSGYFGPGGDSEHGAHRDCIGGAHLVVDKAIFGAAHLYQKGTSTTIYRNPGAWDPEGFLNWLMVAFCTYIGYVLGGFFLKAQDWKRKVCVLAIPGLALILLALILCGFKINGGWIPLNKNLWSFSYTLCTSGAGAVTLALLYLVVDKWGVWSGKPFMYNGMNSILLYVGHETLDQHTPFGWNHDETSHFESVLVHLFAACLWTVIAYLCYRKKLFFTV